MSTIGTVNLKDHVKLHHVGYRVVSEVVHRLRASHQNLPVRATFVRGTRNLPASEFLLEVGFDKLGERRPPKAANFSIDWSDDK
jgi:hypothetical protein